MSSPSDTGSNVLLVVLDSVRAKNTSLYGHDNSTTPFLDTFSETATTYAQARAPGTESISSHTSMFTGLSVREHGITNRRQRLAPGHTIWEELSREGYDTAVFSNNPFLTELQVGLRSAFDHVVGQRQEQPYPDAVNPKNFVMDAADRGPRKYLDFLRAAADNGRVFESIVNGISFKLGGSYDNVLPVVFKPDSSAELYADRFLDWHAQRDGPWAACLNFMDAHFPYEPGAAHDRWGGDGIYDLQRAIEDQAWEFVAGDRPWGQRRAIQSLYDGAIHRMDAAVEHLIDVLRRRGEFDDTLMVITSDHGEGFGERSRVRREARIVGHGNGGLHECILHVPLVVKYPGQTEGRTCETVTSLAEFPSAVRGALNEVDSDSDSSFVPTEGLVVCSTDGVDPDTARRAREYCGSLHPYDDGADAVYVDTGDVVQKDVRWGDARRRIHIRDARASWTVEDAKPNVDPIIDGLSDKKVRDETNDGVSDEVVKRLEELGYA